MLSCIVKLIDSCLFFIFLIEIEIKNNVSNLKKLEFYGIWKCIVISLLVYFESILKNVDECICS